jgi:hypothetical protein
MGIMYIADLLQKCFITSTHSSTAATGRVVAKGLILNVSNVAAFATGRFPE